MAIYTGTFGVDTILGSALNDTINGLEGNDALTGLAGNDSINGAGVMTHSMVERVTTLYMVV
jgi:Ca2+-binding RTX toxin-like protein